MSAIWDPRAVLNVRPNERRCVGTTKKGTRCGNTFISGADISEASQILNSMALQDPECCTVRDELSDLAYLTLCPRWHRKPGYSQVSQMVWKWQSAIETYCDSLTAPIPVPTPPRRPVIAARSVPSTAPSLSRNVRARAPSWTSDAVIEEIRAPTARRSSNILPPQSTVSSAPPASPERSPASPVPVSPHMPTSNPPPALPTPPTTPTRQSNPSDATASPPNIAPSRPLRQNGTNTFLPLTPSIPAPSTPPPTPCSQPHRVRRKPITEDCAVCQEPICCPDEAVWCRAQCGQNIHRECFGEWRTQRLRQAQASGMYDEEGYLVVVVTCVFCRAVWRWEWED